MNVYVARFSQTTTLSPTMAKVEPWEVHIIADNMADALAEADAFVTKKAEEKGDTDLTLEFICLQKLCTIDSVHASVNLNLD